MGVMEDVECSASAAYPGDPRAVNWEGSRVEIVRTLTQWRTPQGICYRGAAADGRVFEMCYDASTQQWQVQVYGWLGGSPLS